MAQRKARWPPMQMPRVPSFPLQAACCLRGVAALGARRVVVVGHAGVFVLVVDLGQGDDVALAGKKGGGAVDGAGDLINLRKHDYAGQGVGHVGPQHVHAHGAGGGVDVGVFGRQQDHGVVGQGVGGAVFAKAGRRL